MARRPEQEEFDRDILDIIPERYDADEDSYEAEHGSRLRTIITVLVSLFAVGAIVVVGWRFMGTRHMGAASTQVIKADEQAIKVRPDDRGGMQVPNQDKLVYGRMENEGEAGANKTERLLAPPEEPKAPPRPGSMDAPSPVMPMAAPPIAVPAPQAPPAPLAAPPVAVQHNTLADAPPPPPVMAAPAPTPKVVAAVAPPPAPAPVVKAAPPPPAPAKSMAEAGGSYLVQLGAVRSADAADKEWSRIQHSNTEQLAGLKSDIMQVTIPDKGTFWRIRAGYLSEQGARALCQQLVARNQGCILVHK